MDMMSYFRLKNIMGGGDDNDDAIPQQPMSSFGPGGAGDVSQRPDDVDMSNDTDNQSSAVPSHMDMAGRMNQLYAPKTAANDAFTSALSTLPDRSQYQRGTGGKILATIAGMGAGAGPVGVAGGSPIGFRGNPNAAFNTTSGILDAPYDRAIDDYKTKLAPLQAAAGLEDKDNTNNRIAANNTLSREISEERAQNQSRDIDRKSKLDQSTIDHRLANEKAAQDRIAAKNFAQDPKNAAYKSFTGKDGFIYFINPKDPTKIVKTDVKSDKLSDFDKLQMRHDNTLDEITARKNAADALEASRQKNRVDLKNTPGAGKGSGNAGEDVVDVTQKVVDPKNNTETTTHTRSKNPRGAQPGDKPLPVNKPIPANKPTDDRDLRQKAIDALTANNKVITEDTIAAVMKKLGGK